MRYRRAVHIVHYICMYVSVAIPLYSDRSDEYVMECVYYDDPVAFDDNDSFSVNSCLFRSDARNCNCDTPTSPESRALENKFISLTRAIGNASSTLENVNRILASESSAFASSKLTLHPAVDDDENEERRNSMIEDGRRSSSDKLTRSYYAASHATERRSSPNGICSDYISPLNIYPDLSCAKTSLDVTTFKDRLLEFGPPSFVSRLSEIEAMRKICTAVRNAHSITA